MYVHASASGEQPGCAKWFPLSQQLHVHLNLVLSQVKHLQGLQGHNLQDIVTYTFLLLSMPEPGKRCATAWIWR
jgi:hypothetical protein